MGCGAEAVNKYPLQIRVARAIILAHDLTTKVSAFTVRRKRTHRILSFARNLGEMRNDEMHCNGEKLERTPVYRAFTLLSAGADEIVTYVASRGATLRCGTRKSNNGERLGRSDYDNHNDTSASRKLVSRPTAAIE